MQNPFSSYPRPAKLSDPCHDFSPEECAAILAVPDEKMGVLELRNIFQSYLPAGTYNECAYFIPLALRFLDNRGENASDLAADFLVWAGILDFGEPIDAPIYEMLTDEARIAKVRDFICAGTFHDRRFSIFWEKWSWKGAFLQVSARLKGFRRTAANTG